LIVDDALKIHWLDDSTRSPWSGCTCNCNLPILDLSRIRQSTIRTWRADLHHDHLHSSLSHGIVGISRVAREDRTTTIHQPSQQRRDKYL